MYAEIATCLGWTYGDIDDLTLHDTHNLFEHWRENPPPAILLRAFLLGKKDKPKRMTREAMRDPFAD